MSDLAKIIERAKVVIRYGISHNILPDEIPIVLIALEKQLNNSFADPITEMLQKILDRENDRISEEIRK